MLTRTPFVPPAALESLRRQQQVGREKLGVYHALSRGDVLAQSLARADAREGAATAEDGWIYSNGMRFPEATERTRWARTRAIISRTQPGTDEDPKYLEMTARQLASIEMLLRADHTDAPDARMAEICDRILLGTSPALVPDALARRVGDHFIVLVSFGLIDFCYQSAKASVLSWKPIPAPDGVAFSFRNEAAHVDEVLAADPSPLRLFQSTLEAFLFEGLPRAVSNAPPAANYQAPLGILTNANERFILAHEVGHTLHDALDIVPADGTAVAEELAVDDFAFYAVVESGHRFDALPPNFSAQGAYFVLTALEVIRQALDLARHGEVREDHGFVGHPPVARRLQALRQRYLATVSDRDDDLWIEPALSPARTLQQLWDRVIANGAAERWRGRTVHRIWAGV
ncbi:MAG: hypothetical protein IT355_04370 [Gemmatimonadaceae bacterium]|nr:hypothetical protein [Gemmatimonadaceae bacterium]